MSVWTVTVGDTASVWIVTVSDNVIVDFLRHGDIF